MPWPQPIDLDRFAQYVVNLTPRPGEAQPACDVYVGRTFAGRRDEGWGNPFPIDPDVDEVQGRAQAIVSYFAWLNGPSATARQLRTRLRSGELSGQSLGCWCAPLGGDWWTNPCHGHVLAVLANAADDPQGPDAVVALKQWLADLAVIASPRKSAASASPTVAFRSGETGLAVDGNNIAHRAFHVRPEAPLGTFLSQIAKACASTGPDHLVICFDGPDNTRKAANPDYKGTRSQKDAGLSTFLTELPDLLATAGLCVFQPHGWEADDALATCAAMWSDAGGHAVLFTGDRDVLSHVSSSVSVLRPGELTPIGPADVEAKYGIPAHAYLDFAAMRGDSSDNIAGVPGIGPKKAAEILAAGSLDDHHATDFANLPTPLAAKLRENWDVAMASRDLMRLRTDLDFDSTNSRRSALDADTLSTVLGSQARGLARR